MPVGPPTPRVEPFILAAVYGRTAKSVKDGWQKTNLVFGAPRPLAITNEPGDPSSSAEAMMLHASFFVWDKLVEAKVVNVPSAGAIDEAAAIAFANINGVRSLWWLETRRNVTKELIVDRLHFAAEVALARGPVCGVPVRLWS